MARLTKQKAGNANLRSLPKPQSAGERSGSMARKPKPAEPMQDAPLTLRLPPALVQRLDALTAKLAVSDDEPLLLRPGKLSRSDVVRLALLEGVRVLERKQR